VGWAWDHGFEMCESTSYIIRRVDVTSFRNLFLIISTLVVGESWASHLYAREICGCVEKAGVGGHRTQGIFTWTKLLGIKCGPTHY